MSDSQSTGPSERTRLLQSLLRPSAYAHPVDHITHVQTHISDVILTGAYAYKLKKPLQLGFLDFSTLELRRHFCEEELRLNRRLAPDLYLAVVPIAGDVDHPQVGGSGAILDYAVQMRQFDQQQLLERVLSRNELRKEHLDELARTVAQFHAGLPRTAAKSAYGTTCSIIEPTLQNFEQLRPLLRPSELAHFDEVQQWVEARHADLASCFEERRTGGFVRECHGDLHLANMMVIDGHVRIFDCIEFNTELRWIDVMSEIAFVAMDLLQRQQPAFAYRFLDRYLQWTGDYEGVRLLRYYMVYRAMVRAKVAALRAQQDDVRSAARDTLMQRCAAHIALAAKLAQPGPVALVITHGLSGSGKTTVSQTMLETLGAIRIRSDVERKRMHGLSIDARAGDTPEAGVYSAAASDATYERLRSLARAVIQGDFCAIVDAAFLRRAQRARLRKLAREVGVAFAIADVHADPELLRRRITERVAAAQDASDATLEVLDYQLSSAEPLTEEERAHAVCFDTGRDDEQAIAAKAQALPCRSATPA